MKVKNPTKKTLYLKMFYQSQANLCLLGGGGGGGEGVAEAMPPEE